jgi:hypothetical protein
MCKLFWNNKRRNACEVNDVRGVFSFLLRVWRKDLTLKPVGLVHLNCCAEAHTWGLWLAINTSSS